MMSLIRRALTLWTDRIHEMPVLALFPHSHCNCRCVMCDIWKSGDQRQELSENDLEPIIEDINRLGVRRIAFSGGEALQHPRLFTLCAMLKSRGVAVSLLSSGLLLKKYAGAIVDGCSDVVVSLDGSPETHNRIRNIPDAFERLEQGVQAIKALRPGFRITGRCVVQKLNYHDLPDMIRAARRIGLDQISMFPVDLFSSAFNRSDPWNETRIRQVALDANDLARFRTIIEQMILDFSPDFSSGFIFESPDKLRRMVVYFAATNGTGDYPAVRCNAPWVSAVIEADGTVRPCFFHAPLGNIHQNPLSVILNSKQAVQFRRSLDVSSDPVCRRCVCSLYLRPHQTI